MDDTLVPRCGWEGWGSSAAVLTTDAQATAWVEKWQDRTGGAGGRGGGATGRN